MTADEMIKVSRFMRCYRHVTIRVTPDGAVTFVCDNTQAGSLKDPAERRRAADRVRKKRLRDPARLLVEGSYEARRAEANAVIARHEIRQAVFERHGCACLRCGSTQYICLDHIIPVVAGGSNDLDNLQPLCRSCNSSKGGRN